MTNRMTHIFAFFISIFIGFSCLKAEVIVVTSIIDNDTGSLRDAFKQAEPGDTIKFSESLNGLEIELTEGQIKIDTNIVLIGNGVSQTIIDGMWRSNIFDIEKNDSVEFKFLKLQKGKSSFGGAINNKGSLKIIGCEISNNRSNYWGGGIYNSGFSSLELIESVVSKNSANLGGGVFSASFNESILINSEITGNTSVDGGGVYILSANVTFINCLIAGNKATDHGGGGYIVGDANFVNCTIAGNTAELISGGGLYLDLSGSTASFINCIIAQNREFSFLPGGGVADVQLYVGKIDDLGNNFIGDSTGVANKFSNSPLKGSKIDPLNPEFLGTIPNAPFTSKNFGLSCQSPCINQGNQDTLGLNLGIYDLYRMKRIFGDRIDIGAIENNNSACQPPCSMDEIVLDDSTLSQFDQGAEFQAKSELFSNATITRGTQFIFLAKTGIVLSPNFSIEEGAILEVKNESCP